MIMTDDNSIKSYFVILKNCHTPQKNNCFGMWKNTWQDFFFLNANNVQREVMISQTPEERW